ncbi:YcaO-like family protein [Patulibacter sp. NPDC049589]|uniref:YcaO-like family protein n=1 Tax=Patulibacter sp. NPDC049589 TaxID=3154731 RepID=UPI00343D8D1D
MIDARRTLDPDAGVVTSSHVLAPDAPERPMWTAAADLGDRRGDAGAFTLHLVGALGVSPADALLRGAGEAVERFALRAGGPVRAATLPGLDRRLATPGPPAMTAWWPAGVTPLDTVPATDAATGRIVAVPRALVDDRPAREPGVDVGPSGAAAGGDLEHAVRNALYEIVERDAVQCAWSAGAVPRRTVVPDVSDAAPGRSARRLRALLRAADALRVEVVAATVPTALPDRPVVLVALRAADGVVSGLGVKLTDEPSAALLGALQEAFQLRQLLGLCRDAPAGDGPEGADAEGTELDPTGGAPDPAGVAPAPIDDDVARARWLVSDPGRAALAGWVDAWRSTDAVTLPSAPAPLSLAGALAAVVADGGRPLVCDLGDRLPAEIRAMGWHVARVLVPGLQPLRLNERLTSTWLTDRVRSTHDRTGLTHDPALSGAVGAPHPLV